MRISYSDIAWAILGGLLGQLVAPTVAFSNPPVIWNGTNAKFLNSGSLLVPGLSTGLGHFNSSGFLTSSAVDVSGADVTGLLGLGNLASLPVTKFLYVVKRTDTYTADGSYFRPFKTIGAAVTQIITNADNSTAPYTILVAPGLYSETITLNNAALFNLTFVAVGGDGPAAEETTVVTGVTSTASNTQLSTLILNNLTVNGNVNLTGDTNGTNFCSSECLFIGVQINNSSGTVTLNNVNNVNFYGGQIQGGGSVSTFTNVAFGYIQGAEGYLTGTTLRLVDNPGGNVPSQYTGNYLLLSNTKMGATLSIDAGLELDAIQSYFSSGGAVTNNGTIHSFGSQWSSTVALNSGSTTRLRGDVLFNPPTLSGGAVTTQQSTIYLGAVALNINGSGVTPTCSAAQNGWLELTHAYVQCVCNGTTWVKTSDGTTGCTF